MKNFEITKINERKLIDDCIKKLCLAFPNGINKDEYEKILFLLYDEFSDRNLAHIISEFCGKSYAVVYNDLQRRTCIGLDSGRLSEIKARLSDNGLFDQ